MIPEQLNGHSIAGQHCVFLVTITDEGQEAELPVSISARLPAQKWSFIRRIYLRERLPR